MVIFIVVLSVWTFFSFTMGGCEYAENHTVLGEYQKHYPVLEEKDYIRISDSYNGLLKRSQVNHDKIVLRWLLNIVS